VTEAIRTEDLVRVFKVKGLEVRALNSVSIRVRKGTS